MPARVSENHTAFARKLRRDMTQAEAMLWRSLRGGGLDGLKFRRQVPIGRYVVDFLCIRHRLAVELDGAPHDRDEQKARDASRDAWLREHGYRLLRLRNELVIGGGNIPLDMIRAAIAEGAGITTHFPSPTGGRRWLLAKQGSDEGSWEVPTKPRRPSSDPAAPGHLLP